MFSDLPSELLLQIISEFSAANSVRSLSRCNQRLHHLVAKEGWRTFVKAQYPLIVPPLSPIDYVEAAKALIALDKSWERRALLSFYLEPTKPGEAPDEFRYPPGRPAEPQFPLIRPGRRRQSYPYFPGQTMGFQPVIDSREEIVGGRWGARRDVVVWGAGPRLVVRSRECSSSSVPGGGGARIPQWSTFLPDGAREGLDDITALKLLGSPQSENGSVGSQAVSVLVGTAAGKVAIFDLETRTQGEAALRRQFKFNTGSTTPLRSMDITPSERLAVAGLASGDVFLFDTTKAVPVSRVKMPQNDHIWSTKFLSAEYVAIGTGQSETPLKVFAIESTGLSKTPFRTWAVRDRVIGDGLTALEYGLNRPAGSVSCIEAVPQTSGPGNAGGTVFFTGNSDGKIRIHDLRAPAECEMVYFDPVDDEGIYSIATKGSNYLVTGSSRHSLLKMFDIRMDGAHPTQLPLWTLPENGPGLQPRSNHGTSGWSVHLHQDGEGTTGRASSIWSAMRGGRATRSPVYTLSSPAPFSPTLYAGLEEHVAQIDIVDVYEEHPDSVFGRSRVADGTDVKSFWDPNSRSRILSYYEHRSPNKLRMQDRWPIPPLVEDKGYDIRWRELAS